MIYWMYIQYVSLTTKYGAIFILYTWQLEKSGDKWGWRRGEGGGGGTKKKCGTITSLHILNVQLLKKLLITKQL